MIFRNNIYTHVVGRKIIFKICLIYKNKMKMNVNDREKL